MKIKKSIIQGAYILGVVLLLSLLIVAGYWAKGQARNEVCKRIDITVVNADSSSFVTSKSILRELERLQINPVGLKLSHINTKDIEAALNDIDFLENAECVITSQQALQVRVTQLVPVMRVYDGENAYYVNRHGKRINALNPQFRSDVPIVSAHFDAKYSPSKLIPLINYVENNSELRNFVSMISVRDSNNVFIIPSIAGHVINIGSPDGLDNKFAKLKEFYTKVMPDKGWNFYDTISVKYNHQVVATRRVKNVKKEVDWKLLSDEESADVQTMTVSDNQASATNQSHASNPKPEAANPDNGKKEAATQKKASTTDNKVKKAFKTT